MADAPPTSNALSRVLPMVIIGLIVVSVIGWLALLYITRPLAPPISKVMEAVEGLPKGARVQEKLKLPTGEVLELEVGLKGDPAPRVDYVGGVVILRYPEVELLTSASGAREDASNLGALFIHAEAALQREAQSRIEPLGFDAEVHFGPED